MIRAHGKLPSDRRCSAFAEQLALEAPDSVRRVAATGMVGRRDQADRATVPPAHCAMLTRLDAKTRPARSETMAVVRSRAISAGTRLTSKAPYKACSGFTHVTACRIAQSPEATFVTRLRPGGLPLQTARQLPAQPTTRWVEPSSTGKPRRLGALNFSG